MLTRVCKVVVTFKPLVQTWVTFVVAWVFHYQYTPLPYLHANRLVATKTFQQIQKIVTHSLY